MTGLIVIPQAYPIGQAIEDLLLIAEVSTGEDIEPQDRLLPRNKISPLCRFAAATSRWLLEPFSEVTTRVAQPQPQEFLRSGRILTPI